jgi:hypothetical protein
MRVIASELRVRSGPGTDFEIMRVLKRDTSVDVVETHGGWSRITPCGWVSSMHLAPHVISLAPSGLQEIIARFGQAAQPRCSAGRVTLPAPLKLSWNTSRVSIIACHVEMVPMFSGVFGEIYANGHWDLLRNYGGIYNARQTRGGTKWSTHAWGIAVDLNTDTNQMGTKGDMPREIIGVFKRHGFVWGGDWTGRSIDPMHFQFADGY